jgi:hypothetical protein
MCEENLSPFFFPVLLGQAPRRGIRYLNILVLESGLVDFVIRGQGELSFLELIEAAETLRPSPIPLPEGEGFLDYPNSVTETEFDLNLKFEIRSLITGLSPK